MTPPLLLAPCIHPIHPLSHSRRDRAAAHSLQSEGCLPVDPAASRPREPAGSQAWRSRARPGPGHRKRPGPGGPVGTGPLSPPLRTGAGTGGSFVPPARPQVFLVPGFQPFHSRPLLSPCHPTAGQREWAPREFANSHKLSRSLGPAGRRGTEFTANTPLAGLSALFCPLKCARKPGGGGSGGRGTLRWGLCFTPPAPRLQERDRKFATPRPGPSRDSLLLSKALPAKDVAPGK